MRLKIDCGKEGQPALSAPLFMGFFKEHRYLAAFTVDGWGGRYYNELV
jgi:hypothetical protein